MINVLGRRGITIHFPDMMDSCEVKVEDSDYILKLEKLLIVPLNMKMLIQKIVCNHPVATGLIKNKFLAFH